MELKLIILSVIILGILRLNRTFMELKHSRRCRIRPATHRLNRTFMELKHIIFYASNS